MKLSLVLSALASIVVLVTAYPMEGAIAKRSDVEKREGLDGSYANGVEGKGEELDSDQYSYRAYTNSAEWKREELDADDFNYHYQ
ncbi:uncharacterized protein HD556DRAFT_1448461 [Suillus plorans]|uniref:Uncharacterized protein n=1 Tax=Suillus plorans TaxID=116603 RepID=A0A9P7AEK6_9AGAM|nr:uncharacterized protein HD556DRAFT_1448461 [Suillus plorans]KAG1787781.1 hypothetical protein HD556DRAFT_1448461 [Suillus plorans]